MKKHSFPAIIAAALPFFAACSFNDSPAETGSIDCSGQPITIEGEIEQVYLTRASDSGFADKDRIGVYIVDYSGKEAGLLQNSGNRADNVRYTFDEAAWKWSSARDIYWKDNDTHVDIYGYYPYSAVDDVNAMSFEVSKDQRAAAQNGKPGGYESSDFLWGKVEDVAPTDKVIRIAFHHRLAGIRVSLLEGTGFSDGEWAAASKEVLITGTVRKAAIDLATGIATPVGEAGRTGIIPVMKDNDYRAVVIPQEIAAGTDLISITVAGTTYKYRKSEAVNFIAGKQHNFTITVNKRAEGDFEFNVSGESITAWENDSVSHDALAREYVIINVETPGTLDKCLEDAGKDPAKVLNLKLTGKINSRDFAVMRYMMTRLSALNLKEVTVVRTEGNGRLGGYDDAEDNGNYSANADNEIPDMALKQKRSLSFITLPDNITRIAANAFFFCSNLTGSLEIPDGVTFIGHYAFSTCSSYTGSLSLPESLVTIRHNAFEGCNFTCELKLPEKLKYLGDYAFDRCTGLYGELHIPETLEYLGESSFGQCSNLTGSITIPQGITTIEAKAFYFCYGLSGQLTLHDGITSIGEEAFCDTPLKGELILPGSLISIGKRAFSGCDFSGRLVLPKGMTSIGDEVFHKNWRLSGTVEIPDNVVSIGSGAFAECAGIEGVIIPESVETIQYKSTWQGSIGAFENCYGLNRIVCKGTVPPYIQSGAFDGVPKDNFTLEVPEESVAQYQAAPGWCEFKRISAYRNLSVSPNVATALNTRVSRDIVLNADEDWIVESKPDWITLSKTEGTGKTGLTLEFSQMPAGSGREGKVVFKLRDKDYRTTCRVAQYDYGYAEDEMVTLQTAGKGRGIDIVFLGDGYSAGDISQGDLMKDIREAAEHFFSIEPYRSYREYFNVYAGVAVSPESGIGGVNTIIYNRFNTTAKGGVTLGGRNGDSDFNEIFKYALKAPTVTSDNLCRTLIVMIPNSTDYGGICYMYNDGSAIAYCPKSSYGYPLDFRGVIQHEAGGHGFGKLGDEYIYHNAFLDDCGCSCCGHLEEFNSAKDNGWYDNLSLSGKMNEVPWSHLLFHEKYRKIVDIYEGGFRHSRGIYRSEYNSCMNNDIPYYSTVSRESIVKRIKAYAGEEYSFEDFVANDVIENLPETTAAATKGRPAAKTWPRALRQHAPVLVGERPTIK